MRYFFLMFIIYFSTDSLANLQDDIVVLGERTQSSVDKPYSEIIDNKRFINDLRDTAKSIWYENATVKVFFPQSMYGKQDSLQTMEKEIHFRNCNIETFAIRSLNLSGIDIGGGVISMLIFENLHSNAVFIGDSKVGEMQIFDSNVNWFGLSNIESKEDQRFKRIWITNNNFDDFHFSGNVESLGIKNSVFTSFRMNEADIERVQIDSCLFKPDSRNIRIEIDASYLTLTNNNFENPINFAESKVKEGLEFSNNTFHGYIDFHRASFPENKYIPFNQIQKGLAVGNYVGAYEQLGDKVLHDKLLISYESLLRSYELLGDTQSFTDAEFEKLGHANNWLKYLYETKGGFDAFLDYRGHQFGIWYQRNKLLSSSLILLLSLSIIGGSYTLLRKRKKIRLSV